MVVHAAVDHANQRRVFCDLVERRHVRQRQIERLCGRDVWNRRNIDRCHLLDRERRLKQRPRETSADHCDRGTHVLIEHLPAARFKIVDDARDLAFAEATLAEVPKLDIDEEFSGRLEIGDLRKTLLTKAKADAIPRFNRPDPFNSPNEAVVRRVLLARRRADAIRIESLAKFSHVVVRGEKHQRAVGVARQKRQPQALPVGLKRSASHLNAQDQRGIDEFRLAPTTLGFGRRVELLPQSPAVLDPVPQRRRTAATMFASLELLGQTDKLEVIVARH